MVVLPGNQRFAVRTLDISPGGLAIVASANPRPGTTCAVALALPVKPRGAVPLELRAKVVHSVFASSEGGFKIGLSFTELPANAAQAIVTFTR